MRALPILRVPASCLLVTLVALLPGCTGKNSSGPSAPGPSGEAPLILVQPMPAVAETGGTATFTVSVSGSPLPTFRWQRQDLQTQAWLDLEHGDKASYTTPPLGAQDHEARYQVLTSNAQGTATSDSVLLQVRHVIIRTAPKDTVTPENSLAYFSVDAVGWPLPLSYKWQRSSGGSPWSDLSGGIRPDWLTGSLTAEDDGDRYQVVVANAAGTTVTAGPAQLRILHTRLLEQPVGATVAPGECATFRAQAEGYPEEFSSQWQCSANGTDWINVGSPQRGSSTSYTTPPAALTDDGTFYQVIVENRPAGALASNRVRLAVSYIKILSLSGPPSTIYAGQPATFTVSAQVSPSPGTYQWERSTDQQSWALVTRGSGATTPAYTLDAATLEDNGAWFRVRVSSGGLEAISDPVQLQVTQLTVSGNAGAPEVRIDYPGGSVIADGNGNYSFPVSWNETGRIRPTLGNFGFAPSSLDYGPATAPERDKNFSTRPPGTLQVLTEGAPEGREVEVLMQLRDPGDDFELASLNRFPREMSQGQRPGYYTALPISWWDAAKQVLYKPCAPQIFCMEEGGTQTLRLTYTQEPGFSVNLGQGVRMDMVLVRGGRYTMGSTSPNDTTGGILPRPMHDVDLRTSFWMARTELTHAQWRAITGSDHPSRGSQTPDDAPVALLSWNECQELAGTLRARTNQPFRLPSEAEWEYAARAGSTGRWSWGDINGFAGYFAWYGSPTAGFHPVGTKFPNAWGLCDMNGNVAEWCEDDAHVDYNGAPTDGSAWEFSPRGPFAVLRGGRATYSLDWVSSAFRHFEFKDVASPEGSGLRLVLPAGTWERIDVQGTTPTHWLAETAEPGTSHFMVVTRNSQVPTAVDFWHLGRSAGAPISSFLFSGVTGETFTHATLFWGSTPPSTLVLIPDASRRYFIFDSNTGTMQSLETDTLPMREGRAVAKDDSSVRALLFGGSYQGVGTSDTWVYDASQTQPFSRLRDAWGPTRSRAALSYDSNRRCAVMFGGSGRDSGPDGPETELGRGSTCIFDWNGGWSEVVPEGAPGAPPPRAGASMAYDASTGLTYMLGGYCPSNQAILSDLWAWDYNQWWPVIPDGEAFQAGSIWFDTENNCLMQLYFGNIYRLRR